MILCSRKEQRNPENFLKYRSYFKIQIQYLVWKPRCKTEKFYILDLLLNKSDSL